MCSLLDHETPTVSFAYKIQKCLWYKPQTQNIVLLIVLRKMH